ncbi:MAG: HDOD domain-containing protein [Ignavibacteriaceae bacterium]
MLKLEATTEQRREKTELVLANIYNLPPIPKAMTGAMKLLDNSAVCISTITNIISKDQGLVTKILTIANSPIYGLQRKVTSIDFAVMVLGFTELKNIISVLSMADAFKSKTDSLNQKDFWLHSYITGSGAKRLSEEIGLGNSGEIFVAGLLHDLGINIIQRYFKPEFRAINEMVKSNEIGYLEAEEQVLGLTHQEMGQFLINKWNLPESLGETIAFHHQPSTLKDYVELASIVHLADFMTQRLEVGCFQWDDDIKLDENIIDILKFGNESNLNRFMDSHAELFKSQLLSVTF